jgi:signal transduction protein with GAF and PtsI domain
VAASGENQDSVLQATVRLIQRLVQVERCSILLLDTDAAEMRMAASSGIPEERRDEIHVALGEGIRGARGAIGRTRFEPECERGRARKSQ